MIWRELSSWYLIATPIAGALSVVGDFQIAGKNYSGFMWMSLLVLGVYLLAMGALWACDRGALMLWSGWFVWFGFVWLSLLWCAIVDERNVQNALQMTMPLVVGMLATSAIRSRDDLRRVLHGFAI